MDRLKELCMENNIKLHELSSALPGYTIIFFKELKYLIVTSEATQKHVETFIRYEFGSMKAGAAV